MDFERQTQCILSPTYAEVAMWNKVSYLHESMRKLNPQSLILPPGWERELHEVIKQKQCHPVIGMCHMWCYRRESVGQEELMLELLLYLAVDQLHSPLP